MTNSGVNVDANQLFSLHHEAFIPTVSDPSNGTLVVADTTSHRDMAKDDDHMQFSTDENGDSQIRLLTQLCELNVALYQHPLHREKDQATSRTTAAWENTTQSQAGDAQSAQNNSNRSHDLNLGDLGTGSLFKLTCRLKDTVTQIRALDEKTPKGPRRYDRPTALMALSCYTRLDVLYSRALEILMLARNTGPAANGTHNQMPELVIDGFSMGQCLDLQLNFLIDLHKQASDRIRACIRIAEGTTSVAQEC
ncbi:hypothetical protein QBC47DRAFT_395247 [Echria macrotheca]|uniref:Uncharacterized protein n=1 Tax=Echria macrotheca TaxID=438768 RepID=A0AAJ0F190_9PEZI|nr:hypothetical protein QBC47DRAFT_395247 [Echria macrotheca]